MSYFLWSFLQSYIDVSQSLALCLLAFLWSSGSGGIGYGYLLLDAMDPVEEVGDLAGDSVPDSMSLYSFVGILL